MARTTVGPNVTPGLFWQRETLQQFKRLEEVNPLDLVRLADAMKLASLMAGDSIRQEIPVRRTFVRALEPGETPPLARLVSTRGRGGEVAIKLYLALLWRCSSPPFSTEIPARRWAELLALPSPGTLGARRITSALSTLERENLVTLTPRPGDSTVVTLLDESGSGARYRLPSTASARATNPESVRRNVYLKMPLGLWTEGLVQVMSGPAVAMLLVLLDSRNQDGTPTWWGTSYFPEMFGLSAAVRTKGTRQLKDFGLVRVTKQLVDPNAGRSFGRERVRQTYELLNVARPAEMVSRQADEMERILKDLASGTRPKSSKKGPKKKKKL